MRIYESFGIFDEVQKTFKQAIQTTLIGFDEFEVRQCYDICNTTRYGVLLILSTAKDNNYDMSACKPNSAFISDDIDFRSLNKDYVNAGDKDIDHITKGEQIKVYVHHAIGFNPVTNADDRRYIENYKIDTYVYLAAGSPPGSHGDGVVV